MGVRQGQGGRTIADWMRAASPGDMLFFFSAIFAVVGLKYGDEINRGILMDLKGLEVRSKLDAEQLWHGKKNRFR